MLLCLPRRLRDSMQPGHAGSALHWKYLWLPVWRVSSHALFKEGHLVCFNHLSLVGWRTTGWSSQRKNSECWGQSWEKGSGQMPQWGGGNSGVLGVWKTGSIHWQGWLTWKEIKTQRRDGAAVSLGHLSEANTYAHSNPKGRMFLSSMKPVLNLPKWRQDRKVLTWSQEHRQDLGCVTLGFSPKNRKEITKGVWSLYRSFQHYGAIKCDLTEARLGKELNPKGK